MRRYGPGRCSICGNEYERKSPNSRMCSPACAEVWQERMRSDDILKKREARKRPEPRVRPLYGPNAHPYLVVSRIALKEIEGLPVGKRDAAQARIVAQIAKERGPRFASIIDWALQERLLHNAQDHLRRRQQQAVCKRGHSLLPDSPHLKVDRDGTRWCGTCAQARRVQRRVVA